MHTNGGRARDEGYPPDRPLLHASQAGLPVRIRVKPCIDAAIPLPGIV